jgi:hypothetical protein
MACYTGEEMISALWGWVHAARLWNALNSRVKDEKSATNAINELQNYPNEEQILAFLGLESIKKRGGKSKHLALLGGRRPQSNALH